MVNAPSHKIYQHLRRLNAIRKAVPALQKGSWRWGGTSDGNGVGFVRRYNGTDEAVRLAKDGAVGFNFSGLANGTYRDAITGKEVVVNGGNLSFTVEPGSAGIYVLNGPGRLGNPNDGYFQGGSNGGSAPASVEYVPVNPLPGQSLKVIYNGFLTTESKVVMHYSWDNWTVGGINDANMSKVNGKWEATVTVPANATLNLSAAFNNGSGRWDNNNNQDYKTPLGKPATGVVGPLAQDINIFPNPSDGSWYVTGVVQEDLRLMDPQGRAVGIDLQAEYSGLMITLRDVRPGLYFLHVGGRVYRLWCR
jgi:hypothetical protein